ncbi:MAG: TPM domain-containing protein [Lachnospiraceae bacterium]|nr:TPM domain-containing protein [Robinsoniella sp.]MDY3767814.1 TPM domain-containing protein [Lachnospiraceae bacterium]
MWQATSIIQKTGRKAYGSYELSLPKLRGILFLIDMDNRYLTISTTAQMIRYMTDYRIEEALNEAKPYASDGEYYNVFVTLGNKTLDYLEIGMASGQKNVHLETGEVSVYRHISFFEGLIALVAALVVGGIYFGVTAGKYRLKFGTYSYDFRKHSDFCLTHEKDKLIHHMVTRREIPTESSSDGDSGVSSVHSTDDNDHGGGSVGF